MSARSMSSFLIAASVALSSLAMSAPVKAGNFSFFFSGNRDGGWHGPECDAPSVVSAVQRRFASTESIYWDGARITEVDRIREGAFRDWEPTVVARRYCSARATLSDGKTRELVYWLRSDQGFAGIGWGFQYCVLGLDRMMTYAPGCAVLRPK